MPRPCMELVDGSPWLRAVHIRSHVGFSETAARVRCGRSIATAGVRRSKHIPLASPAEAEARTNSISAREWQACRPKDIDTPTAESGGLRV